MSAGLSQARVSASNPRHAIFDVKVTPRASRPSLELGRDGVLQARVYAAPVDGAANKALVKLVAESLRIAPARISLVSGQQSRNKRILIDGLDEDEVREILLGNSSRERN